MKKSLVTVLFLWFIGSGAAYAKYGMAGCGLGSTVITEDTMIMQIFAATTNSTSANQIFGITTGTSNCEPSQAMAMKKQEAFFVNNLHNLSKEIARGEGETFQAFAGLMGCQDKDFSQFSQTLKTNFQEIFASPGAVAALNTIREIIANDAALASACKIIV